MIVWMKKEVICFYLTDEVKENNGQFGSLESKLRILSSIHWSFIIVTNPLKPLALGLLLKMFSCKRRQIIKC